VTRPVSYGYVTPPPNCVQPSDWLVVPSGCEPLGNPLIIQHWQYAMNIVVERTLSVRLADLRSGARLRQNDTIWVIISWTSTATGLQGASPRRALVDGANELQVEIPGVEIGGTLKLRTVVAAAVGESKGRDPLAAHRPGSTLWADSHETLLEGDSSRFPTEALGFEANGVGSRNTAWRVNVNTSDLDAPALSAIQVVLNTEHPVYRRLTENAEGADALVTRQFLAYDVARQLVAAALVQEDLVATEYERGSIGAILRARLRDYFGHEGDEVTPLRQRWASSPADIDAELQSAFAL